MLMLPTSTLSTLDRLVSICGPLSALINRVARRTVPTLIAQACGGYLCNHGCTEIRCGHFMAYISHYAFTIDDCTNHNYS